MNNTERLLGAQDCIDVPTEFVSSWGRTGDTETRELGYQPDVFAAIAISKYGMTEEDAAERFYVQAQLLGSVGGPAARESRALEPEDFVMADRIVSQFARVEMDNKQTDGDAVLAAVCSQGNVSLEEAMDSAHHVSTFLYKASRVVQAENETAHSGQPAVTLTPNVESALSS